MAVHEVGNLTYYDTIVIGAGIAGLACASRLLQTNSTTGHAKQLRVLEARDRIGGRIASVHFEDYRLDIGANWIHGTGNAERPNPLMEIVPNMRYKEMKGSVMFKAPNQEHDYSGKKEKCSKENSLDRTTHLTCSAMATMEQNSNTGLAITPQIARLIASCHQKAINQVQDLAATTSEKAAKHTTILQALVKTQAFQDAFGRVPRQYHSTLGALFQGIESMEAAPLLPETTEPRRPESKAGLGLLEYAVDEFDGQQAFLQDGYLEIIEEIAKPLIETGVIELETVVKQVDWTTDPVIIKTSRGNFAAKEVVCTLPLGVLKDSSSDLFVPRLPTEKQEAIDRLGFGTLDKVFAIYSEPWWKNEPYISVIRSGICPIECQDEHDLPDSFLGFTTELSGISVKGDGSVSPGVYRLPVMNLDTLTGQPILCAFVSCRTATIVEGMSDDEASGVLHRAITSWFGIEPPKPDTVHVTRWAQDPYSKGAYSHMIAGSSEFRHRETLQEPMINQDGGVFRFSGEHCSRDHFAMAHGALLDGWRAANASQGL
ncbi:hypothetical protein ACHAPI_011220 [Fusarium lateritium]